jgi:hypothetical protein
VSLASLASLAASLALTALASFVGAEESVDESEVKTSDDAAESDWVKGMGEVPASMLLLSSDE